MVRFRKRLWFGFNYILRDSPLTVGFTQDSQPGFLGDCPVTIPKFLLKPTIYLFTLLSFFSPIISPPAGCAPFFFFFTRSVLVARWGKTQHSHELSWSSPCRFCVFVCSNRKKLLIFIVSCHRSLWVFKDLDTGASPKMTFVSECPYFNQLNRVVLPPLPPCLYHSPLLSRNCNQLLVLPVQFWPAVSETERWLSYYCLLTTALPPCQSIYTHLFRSRSRYCVGLPVPGISQRVHSSLCVVFCRVYFLFSLNPL